MQRLRFKADDGSEFPEWEEKNVEDVCSVSTGKGNTQDKVDTGAYRFYVRSPIIEHSDSYLFDGEAVITVGDGVGTGKVFHYVKGKYNLHQRCYRMYDFRDVTGKYFYYFFSTNFYRRVKSMSAKTSVDSVRMEMITKMKILVPCLAEQQKIAEFLSTIDTVIAKQRETVFAWEERKKGVMQKLFSQEVRFKADDGSEFPEWEEKKIDDLFYKVNERNNGQFGKDKWISVAKMYYQDEDKVTSNNIDTRTYVMRVGDMSFEGHPNKEFKYGRFVVNDIGDGIISELFPIYRHKENYILKYWKYAIQVDSIMQKIYRKSITSSGASSNKLDDDDFKRQSILVPCLAEQQKIADCLSSLDEVIETQKATLAAWEELKKGLLQQMFV